MVTDALGGRSDDRHGAAPARATRPTTRRAAGLRHRLRGRDHPRRAARRRPLQHVLRGLESSGSSARRTRCRDSSIARRTSTSCGRDRRRPATARRWPRSERRARVAARAALRAAPAPSRPAADDAGRGPGQRAGAVPRARAGREAGAARAAGPARPLPVAGGAARDEGARRAVGCAIRGMVH